MHTSPKKFLPVAAAIEAVTGNRPHPATCWRWTNNGSGGTVLKSWMIGGRRMTTIAEVQSFIDARTAASTPGVAVSKVRDALNREIGIRA